MKSVVAFVILVISINSHSFSIECKEEAALHLDNFYATELCHDVNLGFEDCAQATKNDLRKAPLMTDGDIVRCTKAFYGFQDCYPAASNSLDAEYSINLCLDAKKGFKACAQQELKKSDQNELTEAQIKSCLLK
ncbi:MAG: hypothetical protein AB8E15_11885 [Bdellovibrionales bacterium]